MGFVQVVNAGCIENKDRRPNKTSKTKTHSKTDVQLSLI